MLPETAASSAIEGAPSDAGTRAVPQAPPRLMLLSRYPPLTGSAAPKETLTNCSAVIVPDPPRRIIGRAVALVSHPPTHAPTAAYCVASRL